MNQDKIDSKLMGRMATLFPDERRHLLALLENGTILECSRTAIGANPVCDSNLEQGQAEAVRRILGERHAQLVKWGQQNHDLPTWMCILHEETGELSEAILHQKFGGPEANNVFKEAVQVAAVACQIVEFLIRKRDESIDLSKPIPK